jgi:hypothetical protein
MGTSSTYNVLVVANETLSGPELVTALSGLGATSVLIVAPALNSRLRHWMNDDANARHAANERLAAAIRALDAAGLTATGQIGDADPLQATHDSLCTFDADHLVISTHPTGRSNWLAVDLVRRARESVSIPVTHLTLEREEFDSVAA